MVYSSIFQGFLVPNMLSLSYMDDYTIEINTLRQKKNAAGVKKIHGSIKTHQCSFPLKSIMVTNAQIVNYKITLANQTKIT